jgi:branched-chain amino acid transport system permease protein
MVVAYLFQRSDLGLRLRASREDEVAARAQGVNVARHRGVAFILSAFCVGVGGALYAQFNGSIYPDAFYLTVTFITIAMLVVGGTRSLAGAVVGAVFLSAVSELLREIESAGQLGPLPLPSRPGTANVALAVIMLVVLLVRPRGLTNGREFPWPQRRGRTPAAPSPKPTPERELV